MGDSNPDVLMMNNEGDSRVHPNQP